MIKKNTRFNIVLTTATLIICLYTIEFLLKISRFAHYGESYIAAKKEGIDLFASAWDIKSLNFLKKYNCKYNKIASVMLTHKELLTEIAKEKKFTFISTGMSTEKEMY